MTIHLPPGICHPQFISYGIDLNCFLIKQLDMCKLGIQETEERRARGQTSFKPVSTI